MTIVAVCCLSFATTHATSIRKVKFDSMCERAHELFVGTATAVESRLDDDGRAIHTYTTFNVNEWIKGYDGRTAVELRTLGGCVDGECQSVDGMPTFEVGGQYVLFLRDNGRTACPLIGWTQGGFRVTADEFNSKRIVKTLHNLPIIGIADDDVITAGPERTRESVSAASLGQFMSWIRDRVDRSPDDSADDPR